jgi:hypothetical protein
MMNWTCDKKVLTKIVNKYFVNNEQWFYVFCVKFIRLFLILTFQKSIAYFFKMDCVIVFFIGVCFGWLASAISYRLIVESGFLSKFHCPLCNHNLKFFELIPIFSYFFVNLARCRYCKSHISQIYPILELLCGVIFLLLFLRFKLSFQLVDAGLPEFLCKI